MSQSQRIEWLDAMRGFTMILVVVSHMEYFAYGLEYKHSSVQPLFILFRMPLFFFVSGFLAYKAKAVWTSQYFGTMAWKKLKIQVLPALVFLCAYVFLHHNKDYWATLWADIKAPLKGGYWFTWVLLQMLLIYYSYEWTRARLRLSERLHIKRKIELLPVLWLLFIIPYAVLYMPKVMRCIDKDVLQVLDWTSAVETLRYMQFFLLGVMVHKYWNLAQRIMDSRWFFPAVVLVAFICAGDYIKWHNLRMMWANLPRTIGIYALLMIVIMFFRNKAEWFTKEKRAGRVLQYIGTRTLDVYLIHYFFLPKLPMVGDFFRANRPNFVLDLTLSVSLALVVIAFALLTSNVLRTSPLLRKYLFGKE